MQPICCNPNAKYKFRPQGIRENNFQLRETPQNGTFEGRGVGLQKFSCVNCRSCDTTFERPWYRFSTKSF